MKEKPIYEQLGYDSVAQQRIETGIYDIEEVHPNCTVQELRNTETGEVSFGWWENENPPKGVAKTHYDQVKAMSPEELAKLFGQIENGARNDDQLGSDGWLDWLNTEVEE